MQGGIEGQRLIVQRYRECIGHLNNGIIIEPSISDPFQWKVVMIPNTGFLKDRIINGYIRFENFPSAIPKVIFPPDVIHPLIGPDQIFDCSGKFYEWKADTPVYGLLNFVYESLSKTTLPFSSILI